MKVEISNLIILSATPLLVYGVYKYYNKANYIEDEFKEDSITLSAELLNHIACQTDNTEQNSATLTPVSSKKNSIISSRTSSIVDLTELEHQSLLKNTLKRDLSKDLFNSPPQANTNFEEDAHFVNSDDTYNLNRHNKKGYFSYVKKWFGS